MKKLFLLSVLITTFSYSQVTDENGTIATGQSNTQLTGKIGIGTSTPTEALDIVGTTKISEDLTVGEHNGNSVFEFIGNGVSPSMKIKDYTGIIRSNLSTAYNGTFFSLADTTGDTAFLVVTDFFGGSDVTMMLPQPDSRLVMASASTYLPEHKFVIEDGSAMIEGNILTDSNIGIGTSSFVDGTDTYRLSVEGKVRAHAVKVYTNWADFVFEADYKLPELKDVEAYIQKNGHLKDIPSAKDVEANGIELGEMNKLLLQKIEELTLYVIELNKEIETLKSKE